ncbi:MAG: hypothetical protein LH629_03510 [Ignavibacteria bacterium]|nr:hypothetical protein [Ignavibacteria bacterium]
MTKEKLKSEFHKLIDNIDIIDELTKIQKNRLMDSIKQVSDGNVINNSEMKTEIKKWLTV